MPGGELCADFWMNEYITPWDIYAHGITRVIAHARTEFQEMYVVETGAYGKALVLDGKWQSCTGDEFSKDRKLNNFPVSKCPWPAEVVSLPRPPGRGA